MDASFGASDPARTVPSLTSKARYYTTLRSLKVRALLEISPATGVSRHVASCCKLFDGFAVNPVAGEVESAEALLPLSIL